MRSAPQIILFFLLVEFASGQSSNYFSFPEDSATWCVSRCAIQPQVTASYGKATYQIQGKSMINGQWYSKLLHYEEHCQGTATFCVCAQLNSIDTVTYYLRQDISQKKVLIFDQTLYADTVFLDFNLNSGDTIDGRNAYWAQFLQANEFAIVDSVDSLLIGTQYRRRIHYSYQSFPNTMTEGIGPDHGFFFMANKGFDYNHELELFTEQGQIFYPSYSPDTSGMGQYCHTFSTGIHETELPPCSIAPNPSQGVFTLSFAKPDEWYDLKVYSSQGALVHSECIISGSNHLMELPNLKSGIYTLVLYDKNFCFPYRIMIQAP